MCFQTNIITIKKISLISLLVLFKTCVNLYCVIMEKYLTKEKLAEFKEELKQLKKIERPRIIEQVKTAIAFGDLSENAEYQSAKEAQGILEGRIIELEQLIKSAKIVDEKGGVDYVRIGSIVVLENISNQKREEYKIVGVGESDPISGKISYESPLGELLFKKRVEDFVEITTPKGKIEYKIIEIK